MTPNAFVAGMLRLETFFKFKLEARDRITYQGALVDLTDAQWSAVVSYAEKAWKYAKVPPPAQFLEWAGIKPESPAEAAQRTPLFGTPVVEGTPLAEVFKEVEARGTVRLAAPFWKSRAEELAYEYAAEEVIGATPMPKALSPDWILGRLELMSARAQESLARMTKEER